MYVTMRGVSELTDLLKQLADDAAEAQKYDGLAEEYRRRVRENLPRAREKGAGVAELERTINSLYVGATISRWTSGSASADGPRAKRKRPGAAPTS